MSKYVLKFTNKECNNNEFSSYRSKKQSFILDV